MLSAYMSPSYQSKTSSTELLLLLRPSSAKYEGVWIAMTEYILHKKQNLEIPSPTF